MKRAAVLAALLVVGIAGAVAGARFTRVAAPKPSEVKLERLPVVAARAAGALPVAAPPALADGPVRNVILLLGDGMGSSQIAAGRILALGREGRFHFERFPTLGLVATHSASHLVTRSDAAATALATGAKTRNGRVGTDPAGQPVGSLLEALRDAGWATGIATTSRITDASPAAFAAHVAERRDESAIAVQLSGARVDFLAGGGRAFFLPGSAKGAERAHGRDLQAEMRARGVTVVDSADGFAALPPTTRLPVAALFAVEPQQAEPRAPTIEAMASRAIALLSDSGRPFFLLLEEEEIDSAAHANDGARMSAALSRFDAAVAAAVDFAARDGATLVLVLGDHATGSLTIDARSGLDEIALQWGSEDHTGESVPVFAYGPLASAARFGGMHDNTEIPRLIAAVLGVDWPAAAVRE